MTATIRRTAQVDIFPYHRVTAERVLRAEGWVTRYTVHVLTHPGGSTAGTLRSLGDEVDLREATMPALQQAFENFIRRTNPHTQRDLTTEIAGVRSSLNALAVAVPSAMDEP